MTDQASTHASLTAAVGTYYSKKILKDFDKKAVFYAAAPVKESMPEGTGNTVQFTRYKKIAALFSDNTNQFTAQQMYLCAVNFDATLHERDGFVRISRFASLVARNKILDRASEKVTDTATKTLDKLVRNDIGFCIADKESYSANMFNTMAIDGGTLNSSGITVRCWTRRANGFPIYHNKIRVGQSALVSSFASSAMTLLTLQSGVNVLTSKDIPPLSDGYYRFICHSDVSFQITTQPGFKGWISPTSQDGARKRPSEVGIVAGVMVENSTLSYKFPLTGDNLATASGNIYASLLFGDEAYGVSQISGESGRDGFNFYLKSSGKESTNDPTNMIKLAAFSVTAVAVVVNKSAGLWILTTKV